jgi:LysR family transcriptional regulator, regulator for metE and metH
MKLELRHLKLIQAVAEQGSVTKAGNLLFLTQSALSHQLRDAEEKLGVPLFARTNRKMILTPAGERLLKSAQTILDELSRAEEDISQIALRREGILRLSTECYTCYHWLPSLLKVFNQKYPRIEVQIVVEATGAPHQALLDGKIDLALVSSTLRNSKIVSQPLFQDELVVIMAVDHPLASRSFIKAEDFRDEHLIMYTVPEESLVVQQVLAPAGVAPKKISNVQLTEAIVEMAKAGVGIGILTRWAVAAQVEAGAIRALPLTRKGLYRRWAAATLKNRSTPPYLSEFVRLLADNPVLVLKKDKKAGATPKALRKLSAINCAQSQSSS